MTVKAGGRMEKVTVKAVSAVYIYYMTLNVSINILLVAHPRHNMPQLLDWKKFQAIFSLATYMCVEISNNWLP